MLTVMFVILKVPVMTKYPLAWIICLVTAILVTSIWIGQHLTAEKRAVYATVCFY